MAEVVTVGLGYIGLPTSALIASHGIKVQGVDINQEVVDTINKGSVHIVEPQLDIAVKKSVESGNLIASTLAEQADVFLIVVPTPFKGDHEPDISYIQNATQSIVPLLKYGDLFILESTSPVGTTDKIKEMIFSKRPELKNKIYIAYCPERVLPGNVMHELIHNDRVIGGIDDASTKKAISFYSRFVKGELYATNAKTAEMCKLVENASRDVQIAFANELSLICDKAGIDVWELINLANKHPRVNILQPGCGVGGHCIAVDPYFIKAHFPNESKLIGTARELNNFKASWSVEKIQNKILKFELTQKRKPTVALCGLAFKPNIDDLRESPALHIAEKISQTHPKEKIFFVEPNIVSHKRFQITPLKKALMHSDLIFILVAHKEFKNIDTSIIEKKVYSFVSL